MKKFCTAFLLVLTTHIVISAQETFPRNGVMDHRERFYALTGASVHVDHQRQVENATLIIKNGKVVSVKAAGAVPKGAIHIDVSGKVIYPAFIDIYSNYGFPKGKKSAHKWNAPPQMLSDKEGAYSWNEALKTEFEAHKHFKVDSKKAKIHRQAGFGVVATHRMDGISRGTSVVAALGDEQEHDMIIRELGAHHLSFNKGSSSQNYPNSLMGIMALLRQTYYDAQWYDQQVGEEVNLSLEAWNVAQKLPQIFEVGNRLEALRAVSLGKEFDQEYILMGKGDEYQRLEALKALNTAFILPLNFPDAYDVEDPYDAMQITLAQMKHWELAPGNPASLEKEGIPFALSTYRLKKDKDFLPNLRKAIEYGLNESTALKALTTTPAGLLGLSNQLGSLEKEKWANFIITSGNIFEKETEIHHTWIKGKAYIHKELAMPDWLGSYELKIGTDVYKLQVKGKKEKPEMAIMINDSTSIKVKYTFNSPLLSLSFTPEKAKQKVRLSGIVDGKNWEGQGQNEQGDWLSWNASFKEKVTTEEKKKEGGEKSTQKAKGKIIYPFTAYGWANTPKQQDYLIVNATVWTNEEDGVLENTDVFISNGKIQQIGKELKISGAKVIDASGKHLTAGIIDEHSHIAISRGVNEGTQVSSAEVRIGDVINSEDVNIYRQLSGGVTTSQLLHGSANPIGGQSAIIKLRWGLSPEEMKFKEAVPFIKFALGENVKQSNWGDHQTVRFPQTRMGVEQAYIDYFTRAQAYGQLKQSGRVYRKDLDLEAGLEILNEERFITCHSYRQSEINMLMKVAEQFGFRVNTFTHILEGYKVADKMAKHGAGGSSFSDWWAYKYEVMEAIPYNGALMHEQGVTVAFNSDDAEMARRLNQEAAKAILFGGISEEDALKFVTLNPAKLLHIDKYVGSIKKGKHADLVIWSDHPLSMYSKAEKTFVDGIIYFDREEDLLNRKEIAAERHRLIQKMLEVKKRGGKTQKPSGVRQYQHYHCDDNIDEAK